MKIILFIFLWGRVGWGVGLGGQGGCERRIEVVVKIQKKNGGSGWWGVGRGVGGGQGGCERNVGVGVMLGMGV